MGASSSKARQLPPALDVPDDDAYEVRTMNVPRLAGPIMPLVAWIAEQPWLSCLSAAQFHKSGLPRGLREAASAPEAPCWSPLWPVAGSQAIDSPVLGCAGESAVGLAGMGPARRAQAAAPFFPGGAGGVAASAAAAAVAGAAAASPSSASSTSADPDTSPRRRSVAEYHRAFSSGEATPSGVAAAALEALRSVGGVCRSPEEDSSSRHRRRWQRQRRYASSSSSDPSRQQQPAANWFIAVDEGDVMRQAEASTARFAAGKPLSLLDGVPYAIIDALDALPYGTTAGTSFLAAERPVAADCPAAAALRAAGAVLLGKANCHEAGVGMTGLNPRWGTARNPHDFARHAGGSSSGSAAAVAAGVAAFALGLDGGGSVRVPAALCGVAALRPTVGRTARCGMPATAFSIAAVGVIAPSVADAAVVHAVIANAGAGEEEEEVATMKVGKGEKKAAAADDDDDGALLIYTRPPPPAPRLAFAPPATTLPPLRPSPPPALPLSGVRVGVFARWNADASPEVAAVLEAEALGGGGRGSGTAAGTSAADTSAGALVAAGATLVPIAIPELELFRCAQIATIASELAAAYSPHTGTHAQRSRLAAETRVSLAMARNKLRAPDFVAAARARARLLVHFETKVFSKCDVVAAPACGVVAPLIPERDGTLEHGESDLRQAGELMRFTIPVNMSGLPSAVVPVGCTAREGMPVGLQLIGRAWDEAGLLAVAAAVEDRVRAGAARAPATRFDLLSKARRG